ncbi:type IV toxin-antitoxin system AbiEi family antitoxin [Pontibacter sp. MBLB2868]|uniref:type IV toxin-antitoxin system AbiEi family antitoxin n=1 Tax=Pontibacter sp. MBLB2868 TaxID=3451555 RepID=UPI003F7543A8
MEEDILHTVVRRLEKILGLGSVMLREKGKPKDFLTDGVLQIKRGSYRRDWPVEVRQELTPAMLPRLLQQLRYIKPLMLVSAYITPNARQLLQQENVAYADAAGNVFIADDRLLLHIETGKAEKVPIAVNNRPFTKTGLKVLYLLLQHPEYVNEPYRFIAEKAGTGLDTISKVFKALLIEKYILPLDSKKYKWDKREHLLLSWVDAYTKTLKPRLKQRTFRPLDKEKDWKDYVLPPDTCWGGANAGDLLTGNLIADYWTVYTLQDYKMLMKEMKWVPDTGGPIRVVEKFWEGDCEDDHVPPLIAYADLIEGDDPRYLETAKIIYEKHLQPLI